MARILASVGLGLVRGRLVQLVEKDTGQNPEHHSSGLAKYRTAA
jgi:hypothetical protein